MFLRTTCIWCTFILCLSTPIHLSLSLCLSLSLSHTHTHMRTRTHTHIYPIRHLLHPSQITTSIPFSFREKTPLPTERQRNDFLSVPKIQTMSVTHCLMQHKAHGSSSFLSSFLLPLSLSSSMVPSFKGRLNVLFHSAAFLVSMSTRCESPRKRNTYFMDTPRNVSLYSTQVKLLYFLARCLAIPICTTPPYAYCRTLELYLF